MALQTSGQISLLDVETELGRTGQVALNDDVVRVLLNKTISGTMIALSDGYGAAAATPLAKPVLTPVRGSYSVGATWLAVPNADRYEVTIGLMSVSTSNLTFSWEDNSYVPNSNHSVSVRAKSNSALYSDSSLAVISVKTFDILGSLEGFITPDRWVDGVKFTLGNPTLAPSVTCYYKFTGESVYSAVTYSNSTVVGHLGLSLAPTSADVTITAYLTATGWSKSPEATSTTRPIDRLLLPVVTNIDGISQIEWSIVNNNSITVSATIVYSDGETIYRDIAASSSVTVGKYAIADNATVTAKVTFDTATIGYCSSLQTEPVSATSYPSAPSAPTAPTVSPVNQYVINITFTRVAGLTYRILKYIAANTPESWFGIAGDGALLSGYFSDDGLDPGSAHYYKVEATNKRGSTLSTSSLVGLTYPATPSAPTIDLITQTEARITINPAVASALGYLIYTYNSVSRTYTLLAQIIQPGVNTYSFTGLAKDSWFYFSVRAYNDSNAAHLSSMSDLTTFKTLKDPPAAPNFTYTKTDESITLSWEVVAGETYTIQGITNTVTTSGVAISAIPATPYSVRVIAVNNSGSTPSAYQNITTLPKPINIVMTGNAETGATLTWSLAGLGTVTTRIYWSSVDEGLKTSPVNLPGTGATLKGLNITSRTYNSVGDYVEKNHGSLPIISIVTAISPPTVSLGGALIIYVDWPNTLYTNYTVFRYNSSAGTENLGAPNMGTTYTGSSKTGKYFKDTTVLSGQNYQYYIASDNYAGSTSSNLCSPILAGLSAPTITSITNVSQGGFVVNYNLPAYADGCKLYYRDANGVDTYVSVKGSYGAPEFITCISLQPGTLYRVVLVAYKTVGSLESAKSAPFEKTTLSATPTAPVLTFTKATSYIDVAWTMVTGEIYYLSVNGTLQTTASTSPKRYSIGAATSVTLAISATSSGGATVSASRKLASLPYPLAISATPFIDKMALYWTDYGTITVKVFIDGVDKGPHVSGNDYTGLSANAKHTVYTITYNEDGDAAQSTDIDVYTTPKVPVKPTMATVGVSNEGVSVQTTDVKTADTGTVTYYWYLNGVLNKTSTVTGVYLPLSVNTTASAYVVPYNSGSVAGPASDTVVLYPAPTITGLSVTSSYPSQLYISWGAINLGGISYEITVKNNATNVTETYTKSPWYENAVSLTDRTGGTSYTVSVRGYCSPSDWGSTVSSTITTAYSTPAAPVFYISNVTTGGITVTWQDTTASGTGAVTYRVYGNSPYLGAYSMTVNPTAGRCDIAYPNGTNVLSNTIVYGEGYGYLNGVSGTIGWRYETTITGMSPGSDFRVFMTASNSNGSYSTTGTQTAIIPLALTGLKWLSYFSGSSPMTRLSWDNPNVSGISYEVRKEGVIISPSDGVQSSGTTMYVDVPTDLANVYTYQVYPMSGSTRGVPQSVLAYPPVSAPFPVSVSTSSAYIDLSWSAQSLSGGYKVYKNGTVVYDTTSSNGNVYRDNGSNMNNTYQVVTKGYVNNAGFGNSQDSLATTVVADNFQIPAAIDGIHSLNQTGVWDYSDGTYRKGHYAFGWYTVLGASYYNIKMKHYSSGTVLFERDVLDGVHETVGGATPLSSTVAFVSFDFYGYFESVFANAAPYVYYDTSVVGYSIKNFLVTIEVTANNSKGSSAKYSANRYVYALS